MKHKEVWKRCMPIGFSHPIIEHILKILNIKNGTRIHILVPFWLV